MEIGTRVVATKRITFVGSQDGGPLGMLDFLNNKYVVTKVIKPGSLGIVTCTPPDKSFLHIVFDGETDPRGVNASSVRNKNTPPSVLERLRTYFC